MKNLKTGFLALAIAVSFAACKGSAGSGSGGDSSSKSSTDTAAKMDTSQKAQKDTSSSVKADTTHAGSGVDTIKKTVTKTTVEKKTTK